MLTFWVAALAVTVSPLLAARLAATVAHLDALAAMAILDQDVQVAAVTPDRGDPALAANLDQDAQVMAVNLDQVGPEDAATLDQDAAGPKSAAKPRVAIESAAQLHREVWVNLDQESLEVSVSHDPGLREAWANLGLGFREV
jgi:hypothetical protein